MAEPLSIASGVAGIITLSSAVVAAGYKYFSSVRSAPDDLKSLVREVSLLHTLVSQFVTHLLSTDQASHKAMDALVDQAVFQDCFETLKAVQRHLDHAQLTSSNNSRIALRVLTWPLKKDEIAKGRERIERLCTLLTTANALDNTRALERLETSQRTNVEHNKELLRMSHSIEERKMLDWLSMHDPRPKHDATRILQQPGTSDWLLQKRLVAEWIDQGGFLWINGPSGCGKTVLVSNMIEYLQQRTTSPRSTVIFHYCDFADALTLQPRHIVGSIVRQLAEQSNVFPDAIRDAYHLLSRTSPALETLTSALHEMTSGCHDTVYLIVDGVDECPERELLLHTLHAMEQYSNSIFRFSILIASRPEYDLRKAWSARPTMTITPKDVEDSLRTHIRQVIANSPKLSQLALSTRVDLCSQLVSRAEGMFRWIQCQLDVLRKVRTPRALDIALKTLPSGLFETYDRILARIAEQDHEHVIRVTKWLIGAEHPLNIEELAEAIAIDPSEMQLDANDRFIDSEEVLDLCGSLLVVQPSGTIVLAHFSVREYLLSDRLARQKSSLARFSLTQSLANQFVSQCILTYIFTVGVALHRSGNEVFTDAKYPLLPQVKLTSIARFQEFESVIPWVQAHFPLADSDLCLFIDLIDYSRVPSSIGKNYTNAALVQHVLQTATMCYWNAGVSNVRTGISSEAVSQVQNMFLILQERWQDVGNIQNIRLNCDVNVSINPLCTAANRKFTHALRILLENGGMVDGVDPPHFIGNPLMRALRSGCEEAVEILYKFGANFNLRSHQGIQSTALEHVVKSHPTSDLTTALLEKYGSNIDLEDSYGRTLHYWAINDTFMSRCDVLRKMRVKQALNADHDLPAKRVLYTTILDILVDMRALTTLRHHRGRAMLGKALEQCGPEYYTYATILDEQALAGKDNVVSPFWCDICPQTTILWMRGTRYTCINCINTDLCADCHTTWQNSRDQMDFCKGHTFRQIPRPCWYTLESGTVTEDGKTIVEIVEYLWNHFSELHKGLSEVGTAS